MINNLTSHKKVAVSCLQLILADEPWVDLGYPKRPRYGKIIQRFRAPWKVNLEKKILQEMLSAFTAMYLIAGEENFENLASIISVYTSNLELAESLGYSSCGQAVNELTRVITKYYQTNLQDWGPLMFQRLSECPIHDEQLNVKLMFGCINFSGTLKHMIIPLKNNI